MNTGKAKNSVMEGAINQTILFEKATALLASLVSIYIQVIAKIDTRGMAAKSAPIRLLLLAISEINTIKKVVIINLAI